MDVSLTLILIMAVLFACGVYAMMERSLTRVLIGFLLLGNATNLLLLIVMGVPGRAPFHGEDARVSDPLPQALTLTAIVITFAVSAFLLALIYRSWQLGQADTVADDEADLALRARTDAEEDVIDDEAELIDEDATTDFVGLETVPVTVRVATPLPVDPDAAGDASAGPAPGGSASGGSASGGSAGEAPAPAASAHDVARDKRDETSRPDDSGEEGRP
ncbi:NADH-quinone oxidoreductase subunit K [Microbacterium sp. EF45047]|uniref:NADH-quinone oxidoreductase subunit K n=1 Tax=Microbacterium sp. EF45047 TaxID=2809708 RepID=UPI00234BF1E4|nr:NADH-quinone oxidoreductase subunit K [Microbacterium sp. EF45047]